MNTPIPDITQEKDRFPSFSELRVLHRHLLQKFRKIPQRDSLFSEIQSLIIKGKETGALIENDEDRLAAQGVLDYWKSVLVRAGQHSPDTTLVEFDIQLAPSLEDKDCPYRGLDAFYEEDADFFFGRQRIVRQLLRCLQSNTLLTVVGASGSGKSSIVLGGLVPKLKAGGLPGSDQWCYFATMVPGQDPLQNLVKSICPKPETDTDWIPQTLMKLKDRSLSLTSLLRDIVGDRPTVLIIDQFEEIFTLCSEDARQDFIERLLPLIQHSKQDYVLLTMRSDFESKVAALSDFRPLFETAQIRILPMDASELRESILQPAAKVGLKFEKGVVNQLISDVLGEPAALPLLQFVLLKLWEGREHNLVTYQAYQALGGARQALAKSADEFYDSLIPEDQVTAKRVLLKMVQVGQGLEVTSRRITREELYFSGEAMDRVGRVLDKLLKARLVYLEDSQVEISHEALIRNWPRFLDWIEEERAYLRHRSHLTEAAEQWKARKRDRSVLLRGSLLEEALTYTDLNPLEHKFVERSKTTEHRKFQILTGLSITIISILTLLTIFAFHQLKQTKNAEMKAREAVVKARNETELARKAQTEANDAFAVIKEERDKLEQLSQENVQIIQDLKAQRIEKESAITQLNRVQTDLNSVIGMDKKEPSTNVVFRVAGAATASGMKNVRSGPGTQFPVLYQLRQGTPVKILKTQNDRGGYPWHRIKTSSQQREGWIAAHLVEAD